MSSDNETEAKPERARRLAWSVGRDQDRLRIMAFAADLEQQADALEQAALDRRSPQIQIQMQVQ